MLAASALAVVVCRALPRPLGRRLDRFRTPIHFRPDLGPKSGIARPIVRVFRVIDRNGVIIVIQIPWLGIIPKDDLSIDNELHVGLVIRRAETSRQRQTDTCAVVRRRYQRPSDIKSGGTYYSDRCAIRPLVRPLRPEDVREAVT